MNFLSPKPFFLQPGTLLKRFEILGAIGQGGFAITYLAIDKDLEREVVIKEYYPSGLAQRDNDQLTVIPVEDENYQEGLSSFFSEAQALSQLQHPNIADIITLFKENDTAYIVMPYYAGQDLEAYLNAKGEPLKEEEAFTILESILNALGYIHSEKMIHRDIKPQNILMAKRGNHEFPVLIDFGGARQFVADKTQNYTQLLSFGYAPFEQYFKDGKQGPWTDVYAVAAVMYRMVTGAKPPDSNERRAGKELNLVLFRPAVTEVMQQALQEDYKERYQTASDFKDALKTALESQDEIESAEKANTQSTSKEVSSEEPKKQSFKGLWIGLSVVTIALAASFGVWWQFFRTRTFTAETPAQLERFIEEAKKGSTIKIVGALTLDRTLIVSKGLQILGNGPEESILQSPLSGPIIILDTADTLSLSNLGLIHKGITAMNLIEVNQGNLSLNKVNLEGAFYDEASQQGGRAVLFGSSDTLEITDSNLLNNRYSALDIAGGNANIQNTLFSENTRGLILSGVSKTTLMNSQIIKSIRNGIEMTDRSQLEASVTTFQANGAQGLVINEDASAKLSQSLLHENSNGVIVEDRASFTLEGSTLSKNLETGIWLTGNSNATVSANTFTDNEFCGIYPETGTTLNESSNQFTAQLEFICQF